jgi:hypothetical protein
MKVSRVLLSLVAAAILLTGCKGNSAGATPKPVKLPTSPEEAITQVHTACLAGEYQKVVPLFKDGQQLWQQDPGFMKAHIDSICHNAAGQLGRYLDIREREVRGEGARFLTFTYATAERNDFGRSTRWQLVKTDTGWMIVSTFNI